jgi:general secretion pathway protein D
MVPKTSDGGAPAAQGAAANAGGTSAGPGAPIGSAGTSSALPAPTGPVLQWHGPTEVKVGDKFDLSLTIKSDAPLRGVPLQIALDNTKLSLVDVDEGDHFRQGGAPTSFTKSVESGGVGLRVGVLRNQATGATGEGTVLILHFKALSAGQAQVALVGADPVALGPAAGKPSLPQVHMVTVKP